jgi:hypothetical protein
MTHTRWLAVAATLATALVVATTPAPAGAKAPTRIDAAYWGVECILPVADGGTLFLYGSGSVDATDGGFGAFIEDAEGRTVAESIPGDVPLGYGDSLATEVTLVGDAGTQVLDLTAGLSAGEAVVSEVRERSGNSWTRGTTSEAALTVDPVTVSLDGVALDTGAGWCSGTVTAFDIVTTEPSRTVYRDRGFDSEICDVTGMPETQVRVSGPWPDVVVEVVVDHGDGRADKAAGTVDLRSGRARLATELVDYWTGAEVTDLVVTLSGSRGTGSTRETWSGDGITESTRVTPYDLTVAITTADGRKGRVACAGRLVSSIVKMSGQAS